MPAEIARQTDSLCVHLHSVTELTHLCRLAHLLPNDFPLVVLIVFDGLEKSGTLRERSANSTMTFPGLATGEANEAANLIFVEFGVVHVL